MSISFAIATPLALAFLAIQLITCALCGWACRRRSPSVASSEAEPISLVRPLCGVESHTDQTLAASFQIDYPHYELLFCVARADDPIVPHVQRAMSAHPGVAARLLIGDDPISCNPKLNNMVKGWRAARFDQIVFADSNLLVPRDYLSRLIASWDLRTGLVSAPPIGNPAADLCSELECAFLNAYQARWQYVVDAFGFGFAQGKTLFYRRSLLKGGVEALACEPAEDAASTKLIRAAGLRVRLARPPFPQPLSERSFAEVWSRQLRWARLRRATFPLLFAPEVLTGCLLPLVAVAVAVHGSSLPLAPVLAAYALVWYGAELLLCFVCGWPLTWRSAPALILRDALIPILWAQALAGRTFVWKGQALQAPQKAEPRRRIGALVRRLRELRAPRVGSRGEAGIVAGWPAAGEARARVGAAVRKMRRASRAGR